MTDEEPRGAMTHGGERPSQRTLVIIPTYNERENLPLIVEPGARTRGPTCTS